MFPNLFFKLRDVQVITTLYMSLYVSNLFTGGQRSTPRALLCLLQIRFITTAFKVHNEYISLSCGMVTVMIYESIVSMLEPGCQQNMRAAATD